jgi:hypothetical protein
LRPRPSAISFPYARSKRPELGLGGDGDEIDAIENVERVFGVKLDTRDAPKWITAGDVYNPLLEALPAEEAAKPTLWDRFAQALCSETGVDPKTIVPESPLLAAWSKFNNPAAYWAFILIMVLAAFGAGFLFH